MEIGQMRMVALGVATTTIGVSLVAVLLAEGTDLAVLGPFVLVFTALVVWAVIGWLRQRPIAPGDTRTYGTNTLVEIAIAEVPGMLGFVLAIAFGPGSLALVGLAATLVGLALAWPSEADRERHELLYLV